MRNSGEGRGIRVTRESSHSRRSRFPNDAGRTTMSPAGLLLTKLKSAFPLPPPAFARCGRREIQKDCSSVPNSAEERDPDRTVSRSGHRNSDALVDATIPRFCDLSFVGAWKYAFAMKARILHESRARARSIPKSACRCGHTDRFVIVACVSAV